MEDFVDVSKERHSNVWNFFLWNRKDEKAKCKTCDTVLKCKKSSTKSLLNTLKEYITLSVLVFLKSYYKKNK